LILIFIYLFIYYKKGKFYAFDNNKAEMTIEIKECDKAGHINSFRDGMDIKSWYVYIFYLNNFNI